MADEFTLTSLCWSPSLRRNCKRA